MRTMPRRGVSVSYLLAVQWTGLTAMLVGSQLFDTGKFGTRTLLNKIIQYTIATGLITGLFSAIVLILIASRRPIKELVLVASTYPGSQWGYYSSFYCHYR